MPRQRAGTGWPPECRRCPACTLLDNSVIIDIVLWMPDVHDIVLQMRRNPGGIRFRDLCRVCENYFGAPRKSGTSHRVDKTPWAGDPRINLQNAKGMAKAYQVRQVLLALSRLEEQNGT